MRRTLFLIAILSGLAWWQTAQASESTLKIEVTDAAGKPVRNAVLSLQPAAGAPPVPNPAPHAVMDQIHQEFVPHVLAVERGTEVDFPNSDNIHHDVYSFSPAKTFDLPLYKGKPAKPLLFNKVGVVVLGCNIHDWMLGYIDVVPTPWFAKTGKDGQAELRAPGGTYTLKLWQPGLVAPDHTLSEAIQLPESGDVERSFKVELSKPMVMSKHPTISLQTHS